ncbi:TPA: hypothetical protein ENS27_03595 [bacterium]|nr:hypothetical protein [bacterium]
MNNQILDIYQKLSGKTIWEAKLAFQQLKIIDSSTGDMFFATYGVGNTIDRFNFPYERLACYEFLLEELKKDNEKNYYKLHKGTSFYVMSWIAFDLEQYEKAMFYMDAAIAEDIDFVKDQWPSLPMGKMLTFQPGGAGDRTTNEIAEHLNELIDEYNSVTKSKITLEKFINSFVIPFVNQDIKNRSVITAFYSFLLEYTTISSLIKLRSDQGGTIEPIITHLFKGGLIFESLLKYAAQKNGYKNDLKNNKKTQKKPTEIKTLGQFNYSKDFRKTYCDFDLQVSDIRKLLEFSLKEMKDAFGVTYKLRNETGHDLRKDDVFTIENYKKLFKQEIFAILFVLQKEFNL